MSPRTKKIYRVVSLYLAFNLLANICWPTAAFALTNGPGQPEFQSFEPAGTTEMVNLFTGDFNYNIPLMTVPGPNGGYPINLAYHAGISMEQEASWVGLGWNVNAGAINRSMRGLPDDFNGEVIERKLHYKPATSAIFQFGNSFLTSAIKQEVFGLDPSKAFPSISMQYYYNNYSGIGYRFGFSFANADAGANSLPKAGPLKINLTTGSDGIGVDVNYSHSHHLGNSVISQKPLGISFGSREGLQSVSIGMGMGITTNRFLINGTAGLSFAKSSYVPVTTPQMTGLIAQLGMLIGTNASGKFKAFRGTSVNASYNRSWIKDPNPPLYAYGYLHSEKAMTIYDPDRLEDINYEKDGPPTRQTKTLGVPIATYDVFSVSGQGVGGAFRPYRSDIGIYTEPKITSTIRGGTFAYETGVPDPILGSLMINTGYDVAFIQSQSYSGMWDNQWWNNGGDHGWEGTEDFQFIKPHANGSLDGSDFAYEPFYFKTGGEQTAAPIDQLDFMGGSDAVRFHLKEKYELSSSTDLAVRPEIPDNNLYTGNSSGETPVPLSQNHRATREKRMISNQYRTNLQLDKFSSSLPENFYSVTNSFPATGGATSPTRFDYSLHANYHIGEFTEVNPDGNRYVYGIPVYNNQSTDVVFAKAGLNEYLLGSTSQYTSDFSSTEASLNNSEDGTDQYFSSSKLPDYAESYLLTAIYSPDYVDVTGDGPTEDDLGYYVKFNYVRTNTDYKWRAPYWDAIINPGFLSNMNDDKLSYSYGTKEIYFLHSIETKTHVACFVLSDEYRKDGHEAVDELAVKNSTNEALVASTDGLLSLDHIALYSKADPNYGTSSATPLKSVYFTYDYSLCPGIPNNSNTWVPAGDNGKLTLKSIYFTYRNNTKGQLSPYEFSYVDGNYDDDLENPTYDITGNDRWGCYKKQVSDIYPNNENPYVDQKTANRRRVDESMAAWSLKQIKLPSGSVISVNYEADDYAYVQNKEAMQMCRVVGTSKDTEDDLASMGNSLSRSHNRIYFELSEPIDYHRGLSDSEKKAIIMQYIAGIENLYFKMFVQLKEHHSDPSKAYDYVNGYCKVSKSSGTYGYVDEGSTTDVRFGYLTVELVDQDDYPNVSGVQANPIRKAAWQHIYLERPDLFATPEIGAGTLVNLATALTATITDMPRILAPYATAFARRWANEIDINLGDANRECTKRPSYLRLNAPTGIKVGGGHRVKSIVINDKWEEISSSSIDAKYGISYTYRLADGRSSGVAAYEPAIGGDEIALRQPIRYNSNNLVKKDEAFYVEEPMGECYFPAPVVGYSRVIVKSIVGAADAPEYEYQNKDADDDLITVSRTGQTVYEFYTAWDYPVICDRTDLQKTWFPIPAVIPFVGSITYNNRGFSQGYAVTLNDMHGKLKAVSTYPYHENLSANPIPVRRVFYRYNGGYDELRPNQVNSTVTVLTRDGEYAEAKLGETYDFFIDMRQHSNETMELGGQLNLTTYPIPGFTVPTYVPTINLSRALYRSAVTMKVIYRTGILTEVETTDDGATSTARNLMFDAETGAPLLTSVTNEFEKPVYTYNYAAHWDYDGMKGAYNNVGIHFNYLSATSGVSSIAGADQFFFPGDEVMFIPASGPAEMLWVSSVSSSSVIFIDALGGTPAGTITGEFIITRSGHRNLQSVNHGVIVSLSNPLENRQFPLFTELNGLSTLAENTPYEFTDCATGYPVTFEVAVNADEHKLVIETENGCTASINFASDYTISGISQFNGCDFIKTGNKVTVDFPSDPDVPATWQDDDHCFNECLDNVLHAAAVRFSDSWSMDFDDVGLPSLSRTNQYVYGEQGVWRTESNYLYQVDREQYTASTSGTDISKDGTYFQFALYNWKAPAPNNRQWSFVSNVSRYSPYGYALESRDALGIYSSVMYGYSNTKQTAASSNCQYFELAFDGFEDYGSSYPDAVTSFGHGHLLFSAGPGDPPSISTDYAHTGKYSLSAAEGDDAQFTVSPDNVYAPDQLYFEPQLDSVYNLSVWVRASGSGTPTVEVDNGFSTWTITPDNAQSAIEGWKRLDFRFTAPATGNMLTITLKCQGHGTAYFDDLRIQPFKSGMISYVYDPQTHWLLAELDNRNFATFYNYDEEGALVQVKQETEKGIFTVQTSRSNIKRQ